MFRSIAGALLGFMVLTQLADGQAYRRWAAPEIADPYESFYEELADVEPDLDEYNVRISEEREWDYDQYGPYRGTYSRLNYNYGPYNYLPNEPRPSERRHLLDPPSYSDWSDYWYELHDKEPDLDDYIDIDDDRVYGVESAPQAQRRRLVRPSIRTPRLRGGMAVSEINRLIGPVNQERTRAYRGEISELAAIHLIDGRPQSLVVSCLSPDGKPFLVMFASRRTIAGDEHGWVWRGGTALIDATVARYDGQRYYRIDRIATARSPVATTENAVAGRFESLDEVVLRDGQLQAAVMRFTTDGGGTRQMLAGAATRLNDGLAVTLGDQITVVGEVRRLGELPFVVATDARLSRK